MPVRQLPCKTVSATLPTSGSYCRARSISWLQRTIRVLKSRKGYASETDSEDATFSITTTQLDKSRPMRLFFSACSDKFFRNVGHVLPAFRRSGASKLLVRCLKEWPAKPYKHTIMPCKEPEGSCGSFLLWESRVTQVIRGSQPPTALRRIPGTWSCPRSPLPTFS